MGLGVLRSASLSGSLCPEPFWSGVCRCGQRRRPLTEPLAPASEAGLRSEPVLALPLPCSRALSEAAGPVTLSGSAPPPGNPFAEARLSAGLLAGELLSGSRPVRTASCWKRASDGGLLSEALPHFIVESRSHVHCL